MKLTDQAATALSTLVERFENGDIAKMAARHTIASQGTDGRPCNRWSMQNYILMLCMGTEDARTFNQWKAAGRMVKKGSKAKCILAPVMVKKRAEPGEPPPGEDDMALVGFKGLPVFPVEDTDGPDIVKPDYTPPQLPPLAEVARAWGVKVEYVPFRGAYLGWTDCGVSKIVLATHDEKTFFHELGHCADARLQEGKKLKNGQHLEQEAVAELIAATLCFLYTGKDFSGNCWEYIKGYCNGDQEATLTAIRKVLTRTQRALAAIIATAEAETLAA